jgi:hypothetical protein
LPRPELQLDLFDERNPIGLTQADYPGERLIACRTPALVRLVSASFTAEQASAPLHQKDG